jgi:hypothetical protein
VEGASLGRLLPDGYHAEHVGSVDVMARTRASTTVFFLLP